MTTTTINTISSGATITTGNTDIVKAGGYADNFTINSGGFEYISAGGVADDTLISSGGIQNIYNSGFTSDTTIDHGGTVNVLSGGTAIQNFVMSGGTENVSSGGLSSQTILSASATENVSSGGFASATTILSGAAQYVGSGGTAYFTSVSAGGTENVMSGGFTSYTSVYSGGNQDVASGGHATGTYLQSGATQTISSGGYSVSTYVASGATQNIQAGGHASGTQIASGAIENVSSGAFLSNAYVASGGTLNVLSGATLSGVTVASGGTENVSSGANLDGITISSGATLYISAGIHASNTIILSGGTEVIHTGGTSLVNHLHSGGTVDLRDFTFQSHGTASLNTGTDVLTVTEGGNATTLSLAGSYTGEYFHLTDDGAGGTDITYNTDPACFTKDARILTRRGEIAVEDLTESDEAITLIGGRLRRIKWIGRRHTDIKNNPAPHTVNPVRVVADAFGPGQPHSDLLLSPQHAIHLDGALIPVRALINGLTIRQEPADEITYFHIELAGENDEAVHDVIFANGLAAESYLDTGNRAAFENSGQFIMLHPDFAQSWDRRACAPLVQDGPIVTAIRAKLDAKITATGATLTNDPDIFLMVDCTRIHPTQFGAAYRFPIPAGATIARLLSRHFIPAQIDPNSTDSRVLGIAITAIHLDNIPVPLNSNALSRGWHAPEANWRFTTGDAHITLNGAQMLSFTRVASDWAGTYWQEENTKQPKKRSA